MRRRAALLALSAGLAAADRASFDCPMRNLALEYAQALQPFRPSEVFHQIADALNGTPEKAGDCTVQATGPRTPAGAARFRHALLPTAGQSFYVDPKGSDSNSGNESSPFATIAAAIAATRRSAGGGNAIILRQGTYYPRSTVVLTPADSGLQIQAYPGEEVWISGAVPLTGLTWTPYNVTTAPSWVVDQNANAVFAEVPHAHVTLNGTYNTWADCEAACKATYARVGPNPNTCNVWTWHDAQQGAYALQCYFRDDAVYTLHPEAGHTSGRIAPPLNVWRASLAGSGVGSVPGLRIAGRRAIRARYPNADPETDLFMPPAVFRANWTPQQAPRRPATEIALNHSVVWSNTSVSLFQTFVAGVGGTCDRFQPNAGYWCSTKVEGGGSVVYYVPIAMSTDGSTLAHLPYKNATGAIVQTWRPGHWASWMYEVGTQTYNETSGTVNFTFSRGGFQGSRGEDSGEDTYIENVWEELDSPGEYYFNEVENALYFWYNASAPNTPPPTDGSLTVTQTKWLFNITGTQAAPVRDVSIIGLGLRDTAYTYMDPHSIPSGGDWTLERSAVVFLEGTERVTVSGCVFERVDGNAVMLSAYNRDAEITYNEFAWIGSTAVAVWGNTNGGDPLLPVGQGYDGSQGDQPRHNRIAYNLCRELGVWEKQSSFFTTFKSSENVIEGNIVFNGPRAHVNFNDGFRGGSQLTRNLIFNSCRESGDHGPFNSWSRDTLLFDVNGSLTSTKMYDMIGPGNFIIANYNSLGAVDNDDGSSYYKSIGNFFVYGGGGLKADFEGHDNTWDSNVIAYIDGAALHNGYGGTVGDPGNGILDGHIHKLTNNKIALGGATYSLPICSGRGKTYQANNTVFSPTGNIQICGMSLAAWQAAGNDIGTTASAYTATMDEQLIGWARDLLM